MEERNNRITEFYWRLWFGDDEEPQDLDVRDTFTGPEVTISADDVEAFCAVVGNQQEKFKTARTDEVKAPMDYAIVTGWQAIVKAIFPSAIDGDLLKLVACAVWDSADALSGIKGQAIRERYVEMT